MEAFQRTFCCKHDHLQHVSYYTWKIVFVNNDFTILGWVNRTPDTCSQSTNFTTKLTPVYGCGGWTWTNDLQLMRLTSYQTAPRRNISRQRVHVNRGNIFVILKNYLLVYLSVLLRQRRLTPYHLRGAFVLYQVAHVQLGLREAIPLLL